MEIRDAVNHFFGELEFQRVPTEWNDELQGSYEAHMAFIVKLEEPMNKARDVLREELQLSKLGMFVQKE